MHLLALTLREVGGKGSSRNSAKARDCQIRKSPHRKDPIRNIPKLTIGAIAIGHHWMTGQVAIEIADGTRLPLPSPLDDVAHKISPNLSGMTFARAQQGVRKGWGGVRGAYL